MKTNHSVTFIWEEKKYNAMIEREYENSFLVEVVDPSDEMKEKFNNRMVISKKICQLDAE